MADEAEEVLEESEPGLFAIIWDDIQFWFKTQGLWWATSTVAHGVILTTTFLLIGAVSKPKPPSQVRSFEEAKVDPIVETEIQEFEVGETPIEPTELTTETLTLADAPSVAMEAQDNGDPSQQFEPAGGGMASGTSALGGLGGFDVKAIGPGARVRGAGGVGTGIGTGNRAGSGGNNVGLGGRGAGVRQAMLASGGGTKQSERAVAAALNWISRHQNPDGGWGLASYPHQCKDPSCMQGLAQRGNQNASDVAATTMAVLPYLAAGQTHKTKGPYQKTVYGGLYWLLKNQKSDGDLRGPGGSMYHHGLATITLCEAYGLSEDRQIGAAAQQAINFVCSAQDPAGGGWRYAPRTPGDTSVVGWQVMGLKSGMMAGLSVPSPVIEGAHKFLKSVSSGKGGFFGYTDPGKGQTTSAVGLLCSQYLGAQRKDPGIQEGMAYLMQAANLPDPAKKRIYYYYYATQVMHNLPGYEWDDWNRRMRRVLIESQDKNDCAAGSWNPAGDPHADAGGRIMTTSLSCLTLEVYYRYLPLYKLDGGGKGPGKDALKDELAPVKNEPVKAAAAAAKPAAPVAANN